MRARFTGTKELPLCPLRCRNGFLIVTPPYRRNIPVIIKGELQHHNITVRGTRRCPHCEEQELENVSGEIARWERIRVILAIAFLVLATTAVCALAYCALAWT